MTHEAEIERLRAVWDSWAPIFGLDRGWEIGLSYFDGEFVTQRGHAAGLAGATVETSWQYQTASVWFNTQRTAKVSLADVAEMVVHEMAHITVNELRTMIPEGFHFGNHDLAHEERVCTVIARAIMRTQERGDERVAAVTALCAAGV